MNWASAIVGVVLPLLNRPLHDVGLGRDRDLFVLGQEEVVLADVFAVVAFVGGLELDCLNGVALTYECFVGGSVVNDFGSYSAYR